MDNNTVVTTVDVDEETAAMQEDAMDTEYTNEAEEPTEEEKAAEHKDPRYIAVTVDKQPQLLAAIVKAATLENLPLGTWCQRVLAQHLNVELVTTARKRRKYANPDEAKAAQKAQQKTRAEAIKLLKQKYAADLEAMMAQVAAKAEAEAAS